MTRKALALMVLLVATCSWSVAAERMALGLVVKMKDAVPESVVRLKAASISKEQPQRLRARLASAAHQAGISYVVERPTAFAANVIHNGRPMRLKDAQAQAARLRQNPDVEWVVVNELEQRHAVVSPIPPNDIHYGQQGWLAAGATGGLPNVPAAWSFLNSQTLSPVVVAVLDTGVLRHPDLNGRVLFDAGYDFVSEVDYSNDGNGLDDDATDPGDYVTPGQVSQNPALYDAPCVAPSTSSWHGTEIAGQLAAATNNNIGVAGLLASLPGAPVLPVRVAGQCGAAVIDIIEGMLWAAGINYNGRPKANAHPARVISLSFGGEAGCACDRSKGMTGACLYQDAIAELKRKGAILVASSGNSSQSNVDGDVAPSRPASCPGALAVTALNVDGRKAHYANLVPATGIATVGGDPSHGDNSIYTTSNSGTEGPTLSGGVPTSDYRAVQGTSFSAPVVAGAVALMWSVNPGLSVDALLAGLRAAGVRPHVAVASLPACSAAPSSPSSGSCNCTTATCGAGVLDVDTAVQWAASQTITAYVDSPVTASFFNSSLMRAGTTGGAPTGGGGGGGGGGALDSGFLLAGLALVALFSAFRATQPLQAPKPLPAGKLNPANTR